MTPYYQDGAAAIYHGDARVVLPTLQPESVTLLWTDPPYGHGNHDGDWNSRLNQHRGLEDQPIENDTQDLMREVVDDVLRLSVPLLNPDCCCCCCCCGGGGPRPSFAWLAERMDRNGLRFFHSIIWDKRNPGLGWRYRRQHEMVMVAHRDGGKLAWNPDQDPIGNIISVFPPVDRIHPNEKPAALVAGFIARHTVPGDLVLDPFMGSGVTLEVAKSMGRRAIGIDIEEKWCAVAKRRIEGTKLLKGAEQPSLWPEDDAA